MCAKCGGNPHGPLNCEQVKKWIETDLEKRRLYRRQLVWEVREKQLMEYRLHDANIASTRRILSEAIDFQRTLFEIQSQRDAELGIDNEFYQRLRQDREFAISRMRIELDVYLGNCVGNPDLYFYLHNLRDDPAVERWIGTNDKRNQWKL
jgi:predicted Holliday junction resolvase-like endonuclease